MFRLTVSLIGVDGKHHNQHQKEDIDREADEQFDDVVVVKRDFKEFHR